MKAIVPGYAGPILLLVASIAMPPMSLAATLSQLEMQKLLPRHGGPLDRFGTSVSVSGDTAVIGAPYDWGPGGNLRARGSAYVFIRDASGFWHEQASLLASDGAADDRFGGSVAVSGNTAVIGAPGDDNEGDNSGSAYVQDPRK